MMFNRRVFLGLTGAGVASTAFFSSSSQAQIIGGAAFGSWWRAYLPNDSDIQAAKKEIVRVINKIDASMSPYHSDSELAILNNAPADRWLQMSPSLTTVLTEGRNIAELTNGAFDPTVGPIVNKSGFGPIRGALDVCFADFEIRQRALRKPTETATLDFCGIAKGYALDLMGRALRNLNFNYFLLEAGGELLAHGSHPDGRPWQIEVETEAARPPCRIRLASGNAIATSGTAYQAGYSGGVVFSHIADPSSREPVKNSVYSVSVISESALRADALATAIAVMGAERGLECARQNNLAVYFQLRNGASGKEIMSPEFASEVL